MCCVIGDLQILEIRHKVMTACFNKCIKTEAPFGLNDHVVTKRQWSACVFLLPCMTRPFESHTQNHKVV